MSKIHPPALLKLHLVIVTTCHATISLKLINLLTSSLFLTNTSTNQSKVFWDFLQLFKPGGRQFQIQGEILWQVMRIHCGSSEEFSRRRVLRFGLDRGVWLMPWPYPLLGVILAERGTHIYGFYPKICHFWSKNDQKWIFLKILTLQFKLTPVRHCKYNSLSDLVNFL